MASQSDYQCREYKKNQLNNIWLSERFHEQKHGCDFSYADAHALPLPMDDATQIVCGVPNTSAQPHSSLCRRSTPVHWKYNFSIDQFDGLYTVSALYEYRRWKLCCVSWIFTPSLRIRHRLNKMELFANDMSCYAVHSKRRREYSSSLAVPCFANKKQTNKNSHASLALVVWWITVNRPHCVRFVVTVFRILYRACWPFCFASPVNASVIGLIHCQKFDPLLWNEKS